MASVMKRQKAQIKIDEPQVALVRTSLYFLNFSLFRGKSRVNLLDETIGQLLNLIGMAAMIVLAHLAVLLELFQKVHRLAPGVADSDIGLLGVFVSEFYQLLPAVCRQLRDWQA